jgi:hypothetical protein
MVITAQSLVRVASRLAKACFRIATEVSRERDAPGGVARTISAEE